MKQDKVYFITTEVNGVTYFLHRSGKFYCGCVDNGIKTYKYFASTVNYAQKEARIRTSSVNVHSIHYGEPFSTAVRIASIDK